MISLVCFFKGHDWDAIISIIPLGEEPIEIKRRFKTCIRCGRTEEHDGTPIKRKVKCEGGGQR